MKWGMLNRMKVEYEDKIYENINGKWYYNYMEVTSILQKQLNQYVSEHKDKENMIFEELMKYADGYKKTESYSLAIEYYIKAIEKFETDKNVKLILPRITSCFRIIGEPNKSIEIYGEYNKLYHNKIDSDALFTSIAAAYCDIKKYDIAKKYADRAFAIAKSEKKAVSQELMLVYERIKKYN